MISSTISSELEADLIRDEGWRDHPYKDSRGILTIGVGHNLVAEGLCKEAILAQLQYDVRTKAEAPLDARLPWWRDQPPVVQRVLLNLMFNLGPSTLASFTTTLGHIKAGRYDQAADALLDSLYARQVGARANRLAKLLQSVIQ